MHVREFPIIFTDLDGTLLDHHTYQFNAAADALSELRERSVPIILNTSKTAEESIALSQELNICYPLIVENGGAIILPASYKTGFNIHQQASWDDEPSLLALGATREAISSVLAKANAHLSINECYQTFSAMGEAEIMQTSGLSMAGARKANNRQFSEPLMWQGNDTQLAEFTSFLKQNHCQIIKGGRFHHVIGNSDKRTAMAHLVAMYRNSAKNDAKLIVIALGDGANDLAMLEGADIAVLIRNDTQPQFAIEHPDLIRTTQIGPAGWQEAISKILPRF